jgi:hypothetical protein
MVTGDAILWLSGTLFAVEESAEPLLERLDPPRRAAVLMAILGLVLLGILLVTCVMIGGRWVRRLARDTRGRTTDTAHIENQRLREALKSVLPVGDAPPGETTVARRENDETIAGG